MVEFNVNTEEKKGAMPASEQGGFKLAQEIDLEQNYPNPFNPETMIQYSLDRQVRVRLVVYDMLGRRIATLVD